MKKKLNSLKSLIRLHQHNLDAIRRRLAEEEEDLRQTLSLIEGIDQEILYEKSFAHLSPDFMQAFTRFLQGAKYRRALQDYKRKEIEAQIEITRGLLREALAELKRYELARDKLLKIIEAEELKREQKEMDDVGLRGFFVK
ncbi:Flagellar FliJ family protein [Candidatus Bealeia paramacronuclearis]|uniref:Flagellar FliJ family protein n=1 Tax=Candidatus Bealeia paramacronuclearis TaxID=1921001 RepID=A0ABZ2C3Y4_9PROT|nr:Flagellar FliJ family protein [Candidatus Bealeia paramacronuclearis]